MKKSTKYLTISAFSFNIFILIILLFLFKEEIRGWLPFYDFAEEDETEGSILSILNFTMVSISLFSLSCIYFRKYKLESTEPKTAHK